MSIFITKRHRIVPAHVRACNADPDFCNYDLVTLFFQYYVAAVHGQQKVRASTTLVKFLSAWGSFAAENGLKFPEPGTPLRARITRFIKGVKNRYPHVPQQDVPLCIRGLKLIAADMGIRSATDLFHCDECVLSRWARIITAHDACMRATEHCEGPERPYLRLQPGWPCCGACCSCRLAAFGRAGELPPPAGGLFLVNLVDGFCKI